MKPYIGITGVKTSQEMQLLNKIGRQNGFPREDQTLMFGILTSHNRMLYPDKPGRRSPASSNIQSIVDAAPTWGLPMLHYHSQDKSVVYDEVSLLAEQTGCHAVQFNIDWPSPKILDKLKSNYDSFTSVLQLPKRATHGRTIEAIADQASQYRGLAQYVLIDPSGGKQIRYDHSQAIELMHALSETLPEAIIGPAGGFDPENVSKRVDKIRTDYRNDFIIDAESGLMISNTLSMDLVDRYVANALK